MYIVKILLEISDTEYVGTLTSICVNSLKNPEFGEPFFQLWPGVNKTHDPTTNKQTNLNTV